MLKIKPHYHAIKIARTPVTRFAVNYVMKIKCFEIHRMTPLFSTPIICHLHQLGFVEARAVHQVAAFEAGVQFARTEGIVPAPEPNHAIKVVIDEALACKESGESKTILLAHSGHGHFDLGAYDEYLSGKLEDYEYPEELVKKALAQLPEVDYVEA